MTNPDTTSVKLPPEMSFDDCPVMTFASYRLAVALCEFVNPPPAILQAFAMTDDATAYPDISSDGRLMVDDQYVGAENQELMRFVPGALTYLMARAERLLVANELV